MSCYEVLTTVISILSLFATIFFGVAVLLLSNKANEIAEEGVKAQVQSNKRNANKNLSNKKRENIIEITKIDKETQKDLTTYNEGLNKIKADSYKKWKEKMNQLKNNF